MHGDWVVIQLRQKRNPEKPEGVVAAILKRAAKEVIGTLLSREYTHFVLREHQRFPYDIYIREENLNGAQDGDKVAVKITACPDEKRKSPEGAVTEILPKENQNDFVMKSILVNQGFPLSFSSECIAEVERIPDNITEEEIARRRDFRNITTFTIGARAAVMAR